MLLLTNIFSFIYRKIKKYFQHINPLVPPILGDEKVNFYFTSKYAHFLRTISYVIKRGCKNDFLHPQSGMDTACDGNLWASVANCLHAKFVSLFYIYIVRIEEWFKTALAFPNHNLNLLCTLNIKIFKCDVRTALLYIRCLNLHHNRFTVFIK